MTADIKNLVSAYLYPWWLVLLEGLAALILGILFFTNTAMTTTVVWVFLGAWWLIGGIFALVSIFVGDNDLEWYWKLLKGIVGILAGLVVLRHPLITPIGRSLATLRVIPAASMTSTTRETSL